MIRRVNVLDRRLSRTRKGRTWTYIGDPTWPYTVYDYTPSPRRDGRKSFWATMPDSCKADAYAGYNCLYGPEGATEGLLGALPAQVL